MELCGGKVRPAVYLFIFLSFYLIGIAMKMLVAGIQRIAGTSKAGAAFDMCNVMCLVPVEALNNGKIQIVGTGFKQMEIPLDALVMNQFSGHKFPCELDLLTEPRPRNGKVETVVTGIVPVLAKAA